jgi:hypothetical protein
MPTYIDLKHIKNNATNKNLYFKTLKYINLKLVNIFLKIFKNIEIKIYGFDVKLLFKKKNLVNNLIILKKNSSFLFKFLTDLVIEDFPKKKKRFFIKYFIKSIEYSKTILIIIKTKEYKSIFSIINIYKNAC